MEAFNRRSFLKGSIALALSGSLFSNLALADSSTEPKFKTLIEIANFECSRCRAVNDNFERIQRAALEKEIDLVFAPVTWEDQSRWPAGTYYSVRDLYPAAEPLVRDMIFSGIHDEGQPFETMMQVINYLDGKGLGEQITELYPNFSWDEVFAYGESNEPLYSEIRAGKLIELAGVEEVPTFLWLSDAKLTNIISPLDAQEAGRIVAIVIETINNNGPLK